MLSSECLGWSAPYDSENHMREGIACGAGQGRAGQGRAGRRAPLYGHGRQRAGQWAQGRQRGPSPPFPMVPRKLQNFSFELFRC